jgi:hypothetical protein
LEAAMHPTAIRSAQPLEILNDRTPWRSRVRSILNNRWHREAEEPKRNNLNRLDDRLVAEVGLYREHRIHHPENRTDQQRASPVPVASLAMWAPI